MRTCRVSDHLHSVIPCGPALKTLLEAAVGDLRLLYAGEQAGGAEVVGVGEEGGTTSVSGQKLRARVDVTGVPSNRGIGRIPGSRGDGDFGDRVAVQIIEIVCRVGARLGFLHAPAKGVVDIASGGGTGAKGAVHLDKTIFGVIEIGVVAIVDHIAGGVIFI